MASPLDLAGVVPTLIVVWVIVCLMAVGVALFPARDPARRPSRPIRLAAVQWASWGCMFSIFGIAQTAHSRGLITLGLQVFTIVMASAGFGLAVAAGRVQARTTNEAEIPRPQVR
ncbi:MAG: hypothetical protein ACHP84_01310 [Caulobacterales bacterium]